MSGKSVRCAAAETGDERAPVSDQATRGPDLANGMRCLVELLAFMEALAERVEALALQVADLRADVDRLRRRRAA